MSKLPIAVIGAGLIGKTHIDRALNSADVELVGIADPTPAAAELARSAGVPCFADHRAMLAETMPRGVVVATPNATHARITIECLERGAAVLVEKPIADTLEDGRRICEASKATGLPVLVGHQRRHNPIMRRARAIVAGGTLGRPVSATVLCTWFKPRDYFDVKWRRQQGGGPILINLIHDIDLMRHLYGEIESVQALASNAVRGFEVEDTAAVVLRFRNGALGTVTVSDTAVAPWNWDLGVGEAERFPRQDINAHFYSGTEGSLTLPRLELWRYREDQGPAEGWHDPLTQERTAVHTGCPYTEQIRHFAALIEGREEPVCSALDGFRTLEATLAVTEAAATGSSVTLPS
ncbi:MULTISPECIES: Gfo/Idh/MocA family oxidoreductase [unclassified Variovorax]|jgi:predicted dehydrogenase|uniref:Gfo/Idh/MocA family protein n=1 Tax=unclassified Variovorax TaxID=663243 RepID=UPI000F7F3DAB|nr:MULTISPECIES: Gfo/Idh/MocA family oxidoreductase [unclassified Variovorax]RSZ43968.1 Gfo/Idh/MocA family oxidoreductase [Variovorax sp. 553]RSZ45378.1 Gfo/Idh/MocA family oxidoreductase [Variovorax sp. 679]